MKTEQEIAEMRRRLLIAIRDFGEAYDFPFTGTQTTAEKLFASGLGALALADLILELPRPGNFENIVAALENNLPLAAAQGETK